MRKLLYLLLTLSLFGNLSFGQRIRLFNSEQGLPSTLIRNIEGDAEGFIWVATDNGLCRYDGFSFVSYRHYDDDSLSISSDIVNVIFTDSRKQSWVGTRAGLQRCNSSNLRFEPFDLHCPPDERGFDYIDPMTEYEPSNLLLVSISGWGIMAYDLDTHEPDTVMVRWLNSVVGTNFPGNLMIDSRRKLWSYSELGPFVMIDMESHQVVDYSKKLIEYTGKENIAVSTIAELDNGNMLVGCYNQGLFEIDKVQRTIRQVIDGKSLASSIKVLKRDSLGRMWVGLDGGGLLLFNEQDYTLSEPIFQYYPVDLRYSKVHDIYEDYQGNIWVGLFQQGVVCIPRMTHGFDYIKLTDGGGPTSLNLSSATSIAVDRDSTLWVGSDGAGLFHVNADKSTRRYTTNNSGIHSNAISALSFDDQGRLWVATYMGGLAIRNTDGSWQQLPEYDEFVRVRQLVWDDKRKVMIAGSLGHGVMFVNPKNYCVDRPKSLNGWIVSLTLVTPDELWIGRTEGLVCFDLNTRKDIENLATRTLSKAVVTDVAEDPSNYWIATEVGLYMISKTTQNVKIYNTTNGFADNHMCALYPDRQGDFWISTGNGLALFDKASEKANMYTVHDGLQDNEFINCCRARIGRKLIFGGINGLTLFDSESVASSEMPLSPIFLSKLTVMNSYVYYEPDKGDDNILDTYLPSAKKITLDWSERMFSLKFGTLEYTCPHDVRYIYRLREFEDGWHTTGQDVPWATYTNLPSGTYTLELKAQRKDGLMSVSRDLTLEILPPWYVSWWAILLYVFVLFLFGLNILRIVKMRRRRLREIEEIERINSQLKLFTNLSHEIRTPLSLVVSPLSIVKERLSGESRNMLEVVHRNVNRTLRMINQLIDLRRMEEGQDSQMLFANTDLVAFVRDVIGHFEHLAVMRNITLTVKMPSLLMLWIDLDNFDKVVFNLLSNAFKHTPDEGHISISLLSDKNKTCELIVENSGSEIPEEDLQGIFNLYFQSKNGKRNGSGIGLYVSSQIVKGHHGTISASNVPNGVRFTVELPLGSTHLDPSQIADTTTEEPLVQSLYSQSFSDIQEEEPKSDVVPSHRTVFILDDDMEWSPALASMLRPEYDCIVCSDSVEAWSRIVASMPDIILSDYLMPTVDGEELCRRLRSTPETNHIPIIIISSECDIDVKQRLIEAGADNYLTKPVSIPMLRTTIAHAIHMRDILRTKYSIAASSKYDAISDEGPDRNFMNKIIDVVHQHLYDPSFGVEELCTVVGMSRAHFSRKLKMLINMTPGNFLKSIRLKHAAFLLVNNKLNVSDVAYKLGFSSHSYFTISFRDYYGMSPMVFVAFYSREENKEAFRKLITEN
jgi:signal transduction histidine kinase/ligand-binding sensor domain-containing protein/AraC-like DNA-binding protein